MYAKEVPSDFVNAFSFSFTMLKMKYMDYDEVLCNLGFLSDNDKINVFINMESVYKHLSAIKELERKVYGSPNIFLELITESLNLAGHYKKFFIENGFNTKVFLYQTDFLSDVFHETKINEDFRSYYLNKYNINPKYVILTDILKEKVFPDLKILSEFIPDVYFINSHNIEGSLVPLIIGEHFKDRKNLIISAEIYDSQYSYFKNFKSSIVRRFPGGINIYYEPSGFIRMVDKARKEDSDEYKDLFKTYGMYCTLLSVLGDKYRSIDGLHGIGTITLCKMIKDSLLKNIITEDVMSPEIIGNMFTSDREDFITNYKCTNVQHMFNDLTHTDKDSIISQIVDRSDINSLHILNATKFYDHPMNLDILL